MDGIAGQCEPNSLCSFPDPTCPSERRYGDLAPVDEAKRCVPPNDEATTSAGHTGGVSATTDTSTTTDEPTTQSSADGDSGSAGAESTSGADEEEVVPVWARSFGAPIDSEAMEPDADFLSDIVLDSNGNVYAVGSYEGAVDFDGVSANPIGGDDAWVVSFTSEGQVRWATTYGSSGHDGASGVTLDATGAVVVAGVVSGDPGIGEGPWEASVGQAYVARFDPDNGAPLGAAAFPSQSGSSRFLDITTAPNGSIYAVGGFHDTITLDVEHTSAGDEDIVVVRLDDQLEPIASWTGGKQNVDLGRSIAVSANGHVAIGCFYLGSEDSPVDDIEVRTFDASLNESWFRRESAVFAGGSKIHRVVFVGDDVIAAGFMLSPVTLGQSEAYSGGRDAFVVRLSDKGDTIWAHAWGGSEDDAISGLAVDDVGNIVAVGQVTNVANVLGMPIETFGLKDMAIIKFRPDGEVVLAETYGGELDDGLGAIAVDEQGRIFTGGRFREDLTIGETVLTAAETTDAVLMRLDP